MIKNDWNFDLEKIAEYFKEMVGDQKNYFKDDKNLAQLEEEDDGYYEGLVRRLDYLK